jgi:ribulose-phosphate 3-epimerase
MNEIIPAVLAYNFDELYSLVRLVHRKADIVQIDICDGWATPAITWPYKAKAKIYDPNFKAIVAETEGMPFWEDMDYELDLMVANPLHMIDDWVALGPTRIIFHYETLQNPIEDLEKLQYLRPLVEIGLSLPRDISIETLEPLMEYIDAIQCMGIERIGFQSQPFDETVLDQVIAIRAAFPDIVISIDGAVNIHTIARLRDAGANRFVAGSAIFAKGEVKENIRNLKEALR